MSSHLNNFFDKLIGTWFHTSVFTLASELMSGVDIIHLYGGDIIKFAGDAVFAIWPDEESSSKKITRLTNLACQCALALQVCACYQ